jgi:hypothetical protein
MSKKVPQEREHARLAPSAASRWMSCPGSIALYDELPKNNKVKTYAEEGTAAHQLAEYCLKQWVNADIMLGADITVPETGNKYPVTEEMVEAVQEYLDCIRQDITDEEIRLKTKLWGLEKRFDLSWIHPDIFGSNDYYVYKPKEMKLKVYDLKYGKGVIVEPEHNPQLMLYALGALHDIYENFFKAKGNDDITTLVDTIDLVIVQPRAYHPDGSVRSWTIKSRDLMYWGVNVARIAALETNKEDARLKVGKHCKFCEAQATCPEQVAYSCEVAKIDFAEDRPCFPDPSMLAPEDISKVLELSEAISGWVDKVKDYAKQQMEVGVNVPGYKLVNAKTNRVWNEDADLELEMILGDEAYKKKLITPAQAEKLLKSMGESVKVLDGLWYKPEPGKTIAPMSDKRKEVLGDDAELFLDDLDLLN